MKRSEIKKITKNQIRKSALELFSEKGYFETSISEISSKSKISKGLFYHYYKSKEEIFDEIIKESIDSILQTLSIKEELNDEILHRLTQRIIKSLKSETVQWKLLLLLLSHKHLAKLASNYLLHSSDYTNFEKKLQGYLKAKKHIEPEIETKLFITSLLGICIQFTINPSSFPLNKIILELVNNIIRR